MPVENVGGPNKVIPKELQKADPKKAKSEAKKTAGAPAKTEAPSSSVSQNVSKAGQGETNAIQNVSPNDVVEISDWQNKEAEETVGVSKEDKVEISWQDSAMLERIGELIDRIKAQREELSGRLEAARVLLLERAYDSNEQLDKTAEAMLRGEQIDDIDLNGWSK